MVTYQDTRVVVEALALRQGLLVLSDQFHPGWRAYLDGQPVTVVRVNHVLRGVIPTPGEHHIELRFAPDSLRTGGWLSLAGILAMIIIIALAKYPSVKRWIQPTRYPEASVSVGSSQDRTATGKPPRVNLP